MEATFSAGCFEMLNRKQNLEEPAWFITKYTY